MNPRRAVIASYVGGWLFLPITAGYEILGLPDYTKVVATIIGVVIGILLFDAKRFLSFRVHWIDASIIIFCLWGATSSISTGKGLWDAFSAVLENSVLWGFPYVVGRVYFRDLESFRDLALGIVIGGLIYVPLCLIEIRVSPQLHIWIYGYHQHQFEQSIRFGGYRPTVFMQHGLAVAMWMVNATVLAIWMQARGTLHRYPMALIVSVSATLLITTVLCKSTGALTLMMVGLAAVFAASLIQKPWPLLILIIVSPLWMTSRTLDLINGQIVYDLFSLISEERAQSFQIRLDQEEEIRQIALRTPICGGSRWWPNGADQLWLIYFRNFGIVGIATFTAIFLVPGWVLLRRIPFKQLCQPEWAPVTGMILIVVLYTIDNLLNGLVNPIFTVVAGALSSAYVAELSGVVNPKRTAIQSASRSAGVRRQLWPPVAAERPE
ncbi:MAG: hypothetical protein U0936_03270 [Planctomycetaceae bacterium]